MRRCEKSGGSCVMRTVFRGSFRWSRCMGSSEIQRHAWYLCIGAEKNGLRQVWAWVSKLLRPPAMGGPGFVLWPVADLPGVRTAAGGVPQVWQGEVRGFELAGRQSVLHQTVRLLRGATLSGRDHQGGGTRTGVGLEDGQGVGQAVHARAGAQERLAGTRSHRYRRGVDPQRPHLSNRRERFAASPAHMVRWPGSFG